MARGISSLPAGVMFLNIALLLLIPHQAFSFEVPGLSSGVTVTYEHCRPSSIAPYSCANHDIRYPFRLKGEPSNCSASGYDLSCENNNHSLLMYYYDDIFMTGLTGGQKYYVQQINYDKKTIRLVDSGIQEDNFSFIPRFFINQGNFTRGPAEFAMVPRYRTTAKVVVIVNCEKPIMNSAFYLPLETSTCSNYSSLSSPYSQRRSLYLLVDGATVMDVEDSCRIEQMSLTSWPGNFYPNISCTDLRNEFLSGFELRWVIPGDDSLPASIATLILLFGWSFFELWHGAATVLSTPFVVAFFIYKWRRRHLSMYDAIEEFLQNHNNLMTIRYSFSEIKKMTKNFKEKLGEGGYGTVFKGTLRSGRHVAVKMLGKSKANGQEFTNEVATIGRIHHVNVVQLIGFCVHSWIKACSCI